MASSNHKSYGRHYNHHAVSSPAILSSHLPHSPHPTTLLSCPSDSFYNLQSSPSLSSSSSSSSNFDCRSLLSQEMLQPLHQSSGTSLLLVTSDAIPSTLIIPLFTLHSITAFCHCFALGDFLSVRLSHHHPLHTPAQVFQCLMIPPGVLILSSPPLPCISSTDCNARQVPSVRR
jgi:hypothetical protein